MKTVLMVKAALLPLPLYALGVWFGMPFAGAVAGLLYGLTWAIVRHRGALPPPFEASLLIGLAAVVAVHVGGLHALAGASTALVLGSLSVGAVVSLLIGRPWTAEFSASDYAGAQGSPLFKSINGLLSALWAGLFAWLAVAAALHLPGWASWLPAALGGIASAVLPRMLVARGLARMAAGDRRNAWPAPDFKAAGPLATSTDETCDVAIVGAGMGGLTAAALLADAGLKVCVYEHHVVPGGFAHTWLRRARVRDPKSDAKLVFRFDSGVHDVSGWQPGGTVRSLYERLGIAQDSTWVRLDHRYHLDGKTLDVPRDWRAYAQRLGDMYPPQAAGIAALFADIERIYAAMFSTARERGGIPGSPTTPQGLLDFARDNALAVEWMHRSWRDFVARHVTDAGAKRWIGALTGYITDDASTVTVADMVPLFGYYVHGGYYPQGGSGAMADSLVAAIERRGGIVHLRTPVHKITTEDMTATGLVVADAQGVARRVRARAVVCNADLSLMVSRLIDDPAAVQAIRAQTGALEPACSAVGVHLGLRGALQLPPVVHVSTHEGAAGFVIPSAIDPSAAPEGYATVEILQLVSNAEAQTWYPAGSGDGAEEIEAVRRSPAYLARKTEMGDRLIAYARQVIPDIDARIVYRAEATPLTFQRYSWTRHGSIYGTRAAAGRPAIRTAVRNLVLAGAATHGPGVEAVIISGAYAADALVPGLLAEGAAARPAAAQPVPASALPVARLAS